MECKEAEKLIRKFIDDELEYKESVQFMEHIKECENCKKVWQIWRKVLPLICRENWKAE